MRKPIGALTLSAVLSAVLAAVISISTVCLEAARADAFPERTVTILVPFPPGGVADQTARPIAAVMERNFKQPVIVLNRGGAGGALGTSVVAKSTPDGYTLLMSLSSISVIPEADKLFDRPPAYQLNQLAPVALFAADPTVLVVAADSPWKSVKDLIEDAKKRPGAISYSSSGVYGTLHLAMAMFTHAASIEMLHVPYTGGGPALTALLGNHVQALASGPGPVIPHIREGRLRALATWGDERLKALPNVPTFKELGYSDVEFYIWAGLFAPIGVPETVMRTLRDAAADAAADPEFRTIMDKLETPIVYKDAPEFKAFWDKDAERLIKAIKRIGRIDEKK
ncbi:MAG TPA: tripartite tricarboxylate transporter substrate binding protein [Xanthobacteraceae bacterium]|jgi:tripartite-type tricarboxylate transporter receptor subunit TctC|nr:tripartite tricarboxylate transporter substrate binding protein [Xanthobacteraceae bacterium]